MANHASAKKRIRRSLRKTVINNERRSKVKTAIKATYEIIANKDAKSSLEQLRNAESTIMSAVSKGIIKKKTASRKISRLSKLLKKSCA